MREVVAYVLKKPMALAYKENSGSAEKKTTPSIITYMELDMLKPKERYKS